MTFLRLRCLFSKSPKKSYYKINAIHPTLTSFGQKIIPGKHFWDQCINICVSMFGTCVGPVSKELDTGRVEGNFCTAALAENEVWKTKPSLSSSLTLQSASVPPVLTSSMPFHIASPFLAPKSAVQFLSPGPTSWYPLGLSYSFQLISNLGWKHPSALVLLLDEWRRESICHLKACEQTLYRETLCSIMKNGVLHLCPGDFSGWWKPCPSYISKSPCLSQN